MKYVSLLVILCTVCVMGDVYMHFLPGSNNRRSETNENRNNANRLFDSQNNAAGGYCWGPSMTFYEGSLLSIMWTNQHGCGPNNPKLYCNLVLQYMCTDADAPPQVRIRDGSVDTTDTIPATEAGVTATNANGDLLYGMHETLKSYQACQTRERNQGLWISDRREEGNLVGDKAVVTRQNNNGGRRGLECPEERDYYPYWAPSEWKDIAILTHDTAWCDFYKKESQNVKDRYFCADQNGVQAAPNNEFECKQNSQFTWTKVKAHGIPAPDCLKAPYGRDNHLGNSGDGPQEATYNWTLPTSGAHNLDCIKKGNCNCVLRLRYNISTGDLGKDGNRPDSGFIDWTSNEGASPVKQDQILDQDGNAFLLAIDTSQFGRTFQDRSHVFHLKSRPSGVSKSNRIFNLNVRGKRGNIAQIRSLATEYFFVPDALDVRVGDYVHFQWTGCDTNPAGFAGEGTTSTDRSNIVQIEDLSKNQPASDKWLKSNKKLFESKELRTWMAFLGQTNCLSYDELKAKHNNNNNAMEQDAQNCMVLNAAPQYFDGGLIKMNQTGNHYYMSTRNNNFTNRGQKGQLNISPLLPTWAIVLVCIGAAFFVISGVVAGMMLYAKSHPHSGIATAFSKI